MNDNIKVAVRLRPSNQKERYWTAKSRCIYMIDENGSQIGDPYYFDHIFDTQSNQEVYETVVKPLILCTIEGFNATVFAYGQTSTGKTYTMFGSQQVPGIMHLAVKDLFENIKEHPDQVFNLRASYLEIYNEKINDLLDPTNDDIRIRYDYLGNQILSIKDVAVSNTEDVFNVINEGAKNRKIGETEMNERSSRSHTIFRIIIESTRPEGIIQISILNLVDLAGSERLAQTKSEGTRRKEGVNINKSLLTLGLVIKQLSENREFVNFRDSKLTRLLQPSLGGNANTLIIATVSSTFIEETSSTLSFAQRAKKIKNRPEVKEIIPDDYCVQISKCKQRIKLLQEENEQLQKIMLQSKDKLKTLDRRSFVESNVVVAQRRRHTIGSQAAVPMPISEGVLTEDDDGLFMDADLYFDSCTPSSMGLTPITEESPLKTLKLRHQEQKVQQLEGKIEMLEEKLNNQIEINHKANSELEQLRELNLACDTKILELIDELTEKEQLLKNIEDVLVEKDVIMRANDESLKELKELRVNKDTDNKTIKDLQCKLMENDDILEQYKRKSEEYERKISSLESLILQCDKKVEEKPKECLSCKNVLEQLINFEKCLNVNLEENKQIKDEYINCLKVRNEELECRLKEMSMESNEKRTELQRINETLQTELKEMKSRENCEISELKKDISNMTQLLKEYEDNVMAKNEDINRLHRELCQIQLKIEKENIKGTQELILENKNLVFKCSEYELKINQLLNEMNEMQTLKMEIINLRKECERKDILANRLEMNTETLKGEKAELEMGLKKMQSEFDEKKFFIEKLQSELKQTKNVELSYKNEIINLKKLIAEADNEKCKTIEEMKRIKREYNEKHAECENDNIKIQRLMSENQELLQKYEDCKLKMNQLAKENRKMESLEIELSNLKRECTNKDFSIDRLENDIKNLEQELNEKNSSMQSSSGIPKTVKIFTSKELIRKPIISPPAHVQDDSDCDSKLNLELQLKIHNLQKREGMLVDENKTLLEKKQQLEAELVSSQEKLEILQTKYVQVKTICNHRFKEIRKLEAQLEAKQM